MLISRSWSTFDMAGWSFCQGKIGRDCVQPFSMFSLRVSGCFCGAKKQLRNSLESNCFLVMRWIDILFLQRSCLFPCLPSPPSTEAKSGACVTEMHHLFFELIQYMGLWLRMSSTPFKLIRNCPSKVKESGFSSAKALFYGYLLPSCLTASETQWREKNTSCTTDRMYSFDCQSYLLYSYSLVTILLILTVCTFSFFGNPCQKLLLYMVRVECSQNQNRLTACLGFMDVDIHMEAAG